MNKVNAGLEIYLAAELIRVTGNARESEPK